MSGEPELRWRWVCPAWLSWPQAEIYSSLPRRILRELALQRLIRAQSLYSHCHPTRIRRDSIDTLFHTAAQTGEPICWRGHIY
jgi:hypothetical protein